jgi:hypothetical protein
VRDEQGWQRDEDAPGFEGWPMLYASGKVQALNVHAEIMGAASGGHRR